MKTLRNLITGIFLFGSVISGAQSTEAQGPQSQIVDEELPVVGVRYYYYPNLDAYFDSHTNLYIYQKDGQWIKSQQLASGYRGYSVMNNVRVEITDYNGDTPFVLLKSHQQQFPKNYSAKRKPPKTIVVKQEEATVAYK